MPTPPVPTAIKEARGTVRRDRANPAEPKPPTLSVGSKPPAWITGERRTRAWTDLSELLTAQRLLTVLDSAALALLVDAYGDYLEATDLVTGKLCGRCGLALTTKSCTSEDGHSAGRRYYTTTTKEGSLMIRPHPAMAVRQDAWKRVVTLLREFGMTPSARTRVAAADPVDEDPLESFFSGAVQ